LAQHSYAGGKAESLRKNGVLTENVTERIIITVKVEIGSPNGVEIVSIYAVESNGGAILYGVAESAVHNAVKAAVRLIPAEALTAIQSIFERKVVEPFYCHRVFGTDNFHNNTPFTVV